MGVRLCKKITEKRRQSQAVPTTSQLNKFVCLAYPFYSIYKNAFLFQKLQPLSRFFFPTISVTKSV